MNTDQLFAWMRRHRITQPCDRCGYGLPAFRDHRERAVCVGCVDEAVLKATRRKAPPPWSVGL